MWGGRVKTPDHFLSLSAEWRQRNVFGTLKVDLYAEERDQERAKPLLLVLWGFRLLGRTDGVRVPSLEVRIPSVDVKYGLVGGCHVHLLPPKIQILCISEKALLPSYRHDAVLTKHADVVVHTHDETHGCANVVVEVYERW